VRVKRRARQWEPTPTVVLVGRWQDEHTNVG
jgi:hypothetical protein